MDAAAHKDLIRKEFARQARVQASSGHPRRVERVTPMIDLAKPGPSDRVLDAACGGGFVLQAFAPKVRAGLGVDLTPEMVDLARKLAAARKLSTVEFLTGDVEDLRLQAGSFEIVTCRASFDHFADPAKALSEMKRVLSPEGRIVLYEYMAPPEPAKAKLYQEIEFSRDPSHIRSSSVPEYEDLFGKCGLQERGRVTTLFKRDFDEWMTPVDSDAEKKARTRKLLEGSVDGDRAGLGVRLRGPKITFTHKCMAFLLVPKK
jgi:ubiquinone/menaquinone biosynthesis C-methylase UbiE